MELLKELTEAFGAPGFEDEIRNIVLRELKGLVDEVSIDKLGSVIAVKNGAGKSKKRLKVMLAGHMDEIGFVVKHIDDKGFVRLNPLGGFDPKTLIAKRVMIQGIRKKFVGVIGTKPVHLMSAEEKTKMPTLKDLFVDMGLTAGEAKKSIAIGAPVTLVQQFMEFGDLVSCKSLDNRIAVWTLIKTLQKLKGKPSSVDVYAVFTAQEEVGIRGAITSAYHVEPDVGVAVDITIACDMPDISDAEHVTQLGAGTAIKICDASAISNPKLVSFLKKLAEKKKIRYQMEILPQGGTDAGGMQRTRGGVPVVTLSVPTRYAHTVVEAAHKKDLQATVDLLTAFLQEADKGDFGYN
ncbi:MAG: endoglucanase [Deltaproteobacteria bacterium RIFCSPLOWO2_02_FULL_46_8]|nr:MAG: endoglucanase [Deltaproteobacteria bacterium RIFCSPLOWO2_02_FULL_46_8]